MAENLDLDNIDQVTLNDGEKKTDDQPTGDICNPEFDALNAEIAEWKDKYLRLAAELENTRRRAALDTESAARNRAMSVAQNFLPVMDAIGAAMSHTPNDDGINAMARAMDAAFTQVGVTKIESVGQILNPMLHNAIQVVDVPQSDCPCAVKKIPNTIVGELQAGYLFGDSVLRPAMVVVGK